MRKASNMSDYADSADGAAEKAAKYQKELIERLQPGDVIFYATSTSASFSGLDAEQFHKFSVLAAYAQAFPYVISGKANGWSPLADDFKPWHHVAVCVDPPAGEPADSRWAVGFNQDDWQGITANMMESYQIVPVDGQRLFALTPPWGFDTKSVISAARAQENTAEYSKKGLLAFVMATRARMMGPGTERESLLDRAYGTHVAAREADQELNPKHSCATAAASALEAAGITLRLVEPPIPEPAALAVAMTQHAAQSPALKAMKALLDKLNGGAEVFMGSLATKSSAEMHAQHPHLVSFIGDFGIPLGGPWEEMKDQFVEAVLAKTLAAADRGGLPPKFGGDVQDGGATTPTASVGALIDIAVTGLVEEGASGQDLEKAGRLDRALTTSPGASHLVLSPAMLWDALAQPVTDGGQGFTEVVV